MGGSWGGRELGRRELGRREKGREGLATRLLDAAELGV